MRYLFATIFAILLFDNTAKSQILSLSYSEILNSSRSMDAELVTQTEEEICILWFKKIVYRYFFDNKKQMYVFLSFEPRSSCEMDEIIIAKSSSHKLWKVEYIDDKPCKIYQKGSEFTGFYHLDEDRSLVATAYSPTHVLNTIIIAKSW